MEEEEELDEMKREEKDRSEGKENCATEENRDEGKQQQQLQH